MRYISKNKKIEVIFKQNSCVFVGDSSFESSDPIDIVDDFTVSNLVKSFALFSEFKLRRQNSYAALGPDYLSIKLDLKNKEITIFGNLLGKPASLGGAISIILKNLYGE